MKKITTLMLSAFAAATAFAQNPVQCSFTSITSNITSNTTLTASTLYRLEGCIHVTNGTTLIIPAGTKIMGQKSSTAPGGLIIDKGAYLIVQGTSTNRVLFTTDQTATNKNAGDWQGIVIAGKATNNSSNSLTVTRCTSVTGGGTNDADSSGSLKYMRVEYATNAVTFLSAGNKTVVDNIEAAYPSQNAFEFLGGTVRAKHLVSLNAYANDFVFNNGNRSYLQFGVAVRLNSSAHVSAGSNGIVMANNDNSAGSYAGTPMTHPVISDVSLFGPLYCGASGISSDYKNGILMYHNTEGGVYNSFIGGYPVGLRMEDLTTLQNADVNFTLNFSENSFAANTTDYSNNATWPASCATSLADWITNGASFCSAQPNNQFPSYTTGYSSTICGAYSSTTPSFVLGTTSLLTADYSAADLGSTFFTTGTSKHGGFNTSSSWAASWTGWDPQSFKQCTDNAREANTTGVGSIGREVSSLQLAPNPSEGITYAMFDAAQAGKATVTIIDNVTGKVVRTVANTIEKGAQRISLETKGLSTGVYTVNVQTTDGSMQRAKLLVR
jgi:hypothetical protein